MGELTHLARELDELSDVEDVRTGTTGDHVVLFNSNAGVYNSLTSRILTTLGGYDADLFESKSDSYDWIAVANIE